MAISTRKDDYRVEREVAAFIDKNLYDDTNLFSSYRRTDSYNEQIKGSDVVLTTTDGLVTEGITDEKVAISRANLDLNTFSLELSFLNKANNEQDGWLIDETKETTHYMFGWIIKAVIPYNQARHRYEYHKIDRDNIKRLQWALVPRKAIMDYLLERGWTVDKLRNEAKEIRERGYVQSGANIRFFYSSDNPFMKEKPINILLTKETYLNLSVKNGIINV